MDAISICPTLKYFQSNMFKMECLSPEIQEVQTLLDEWNLPSLKETFATEEITVRALECLQEEDKDINEIIPKFGVRKIFWSCLKKWKAERYKQPEMQNQSSISSSSIQQYSTPNKFNTIQSINSSTSLQKHSTPIVSRFNVLQTSTNFEDNQPSTSGIVEQSTKISQVYNKIECEEPKIHEPTQTIDFEALNLKKILEHESVKSQKIKSYYKSFRSLNAKHQDLLVDIIIRAIYDQIKDLSNRMAVFKFLAQQIEERFPGEEKLTYIGNKKNRGKLLNKFYIIKYKEQQSKINTPNISDGYANAYEEPKSSTPDIIMKEQISNPAIEETDDENILKWNIDDILNSDKKKSEIIILYYNKHQSLNTITRGKLINLLLKALYDANVQLGPETHQIFLRFAKQIVKRFPGERMEDYYIPGTANCRFLRYYYNRKNLYGDKDQNKSKTNKVTSDINSIDGAYDFEDNDSLNLDSQTSRLINDSNEISNTAGKLNEGKVNIVELLELNKTKSEAIEKYFYEHGELDRTNRSMLVDMLIRALYYDILNNPLRLPIFDSLAKQIELQFPGEKRKDYFDERNNSGKLVNKFYNYKRYLQETGKELPLP